MTDNSSHSGFSQLGVRVLSGIALILIFVPFLLLGGTWFSGFCVLLSLVLFAEWVMMIRSGNGGFVWLLVGAAYTSLPALLLPFIRSSDNGLLYVFFLFGVVASTDIGAYFVGRLIGGAKLAPVISPNKTWSGALGGLFLALICGFLFILLGFDTLTLLGALFLSFASQLGDLFESWTKRHFGVKDSGSWVPGHGGLLDRLDGLLVALIPTFFYAWLLL